jgi:hypothetical protein
VAQESRQRAASCDFGAIVASQEAIRVFWLGPTDGALYASDKNELADHKARRLDHPAWVLASVAGEQRWRGAAKARSRWAREASRTRWDGMEGPKGPGSGTRATPGGCPTSVRLVWPGAGPGATARHPRVRSPIACPPSPAAARIKPVLTPVLGGAAV